MADLHAPDKGRPGNSEHPLAQAIVNYAEEKGTKKIPVSDFISFSGLVNYYYSFTEVSL